MSTTETVTQTQLGQIPAETAQPKEVHVNHTEIHQDRASKPAKVKRNNQTGALGSFASGSLAATSGTGPKMRTCDVNGATSGPSNQIETMEAVAKTGQRKVTNAGKLGC